MESQISYKSYNETMGQSYLLKDHGLNLCLAEVSPQRILLLAKFSMFLRIFETSAA